MTGESRRFAAAALLGAAAGMRCFSAPAVVSARLQGRVWSWRRNRAERLLRRPAIETALLAAAAAELVADKLPIIGDRIHPGPLAARAASGALAGWAISRRKESALGLAITGAASAVAVAFVAWRVRRFITSRSRVPDFIVAVCEDAIAIATARSARYP